MDPNSFKVKWNLRTALAFSLLVPVWALSLWQATQSVWTLTALPDPHAHIPRYAPLAELLEGVPEVDLYAQRGKRKPKLRVYWNSQYAVAPTVLHLQFDPAAVFRQIGNQPKYRVVVDTGTRDNFEQFFEEFKRIAESENQRAERNHIGHGIGLLSSHEVK